MNRRRGVAVLLVLLMVIVAMALSYAVMREQYTATTLQSNAGLGMSARQAALAGMSVALKNMQSSSWAGVGTSLNQSLGTYAQFQVTFTTGDPSLTAGQPNYSDYPYRVTVVSVGTVTDPGNPSRVSSYTIQAVVHLVPRALAAEPANWTTMCGYTLYEWTSGTFAVNIPYRVQGPVRVQQQLKLALASSSSPWYGWSSSTRTRYLGDLYAMFTPGSSDFRPFNGPISLPYSSQASGDVSLLNTTMAIPTSNVAQQNIATWMSNTNVTSYQLYPGGKVYSVPSLAQSLQNTTLAPDPIANPAGLFFCPGALSLYNNVSIQGTVITQGNGTGDLLIYGTNVHLQPFDLPPLQGTTAAVELPVAVLGDNLTIETGANASIAGLISAGSDLDVLTDTQYGASKWTVATSQNGMALESYLQSHLTTFSATEIHRMVLAGCVKINGVVGLSSGNVAAGQQVEACTRIFLGRAFAKNVNVYGRTEWYQGSAWWNACYSLFTSQLSGHSPITLFPVWMQNILILQTEPQYGLWPDPLNPYYHWKNPQDTIYVPKASDGGLRWDLLSWTESP
jgi:hypothetical protein